MSTRLLAMSVFALVVGACSGSGATGGAGGGAGGGGGGGGGDAGVNRCGNGMLETDEVCENLELRGQTCVSQGFELGQLRCTSSCALDLSACSKCGDGKISGPEQCDTANQLFGGKTCASEVDAGATGDLDCAQQCTQISTAACRFPPGRNEPCDLIRGCAAGLVCDLVSSAPLTLRCRAHCELAGAGSDAGCPAGTLCTDGTIEIQGASASPPAWVTCAAGCGAGFACADAGTGSSYCARRTGYCQ